MFAFGFRMIRDKYKALIIYILAAVGFVEMYIALFPTVRDQADTFDEMLKTFPPEMFKAMNIDPSTLSFGNLESYMSSEFMSFLWPIMAIIFAISIANYISVSEVDKGTVETLASLPAKRTKVILERYSAGLMILAVFTIVSIMSAIPLAALHSTDFIFANFVTATVGSMLFVWAVYSLAMLFSVVFSEKGKATMAVGGVLILMYVVNIIASLNDNLVNLKYFSFFEYFNGSELLGSNSYPEYSVIVLAGFAIVSTIIAVLWYNKRDLSV